MKKTVGFAAVILCLCLLLSACSAAAHHPTSTPAPATTTTNASGFISEQEAIAVAETHFGIKNETVDETTGYLMTYIVTQCPTAELPFYKVALRWQVKVDGVASHWSTLDTVEIDAVHGSIRIL